MDIPPEVTIAVSTALSASVGAAFRWLGRSKEQKAAEANRDAAAIPKLLDAFEQSRRETADLSRRLDDCEEKHGQALERESARSKATASMIDELVRVRRAMGAADDTGEHELLEHQREMLRSTPPPRMPVAIRGPVIVLVVDDEAPVRRAIQRMLEGAGFTALAVETVREALRTLATRTIDVVITDILMPDRSGIDLLQTLRQSYPAIPLVLISGHQEWGAQLAEAEGVHFIAKPFTVDDLAAIVTEALRAARHAEGRM